jgi:hypothetical protein
MRACVCVCRMKKSVYGNIEDMLIAVRMVTPQGYVCVSVCACMSCALAEFVLTVCTPQHGREELRSAAHVVWPGHIPGWWAGRGSFYYVGGSVILVLVLVLVSRRARTDDTRL